MTGKVLNVRDITDRDSIGCSIARRHLEWETLRQNQITEWKEIQNYVYATDTTKTSNSALPWKNKTTIPKICQIRDNLIANYMAAIFPKRLWLRWEAGNKDANAKLKRDSILNWMRHVVSQPMFKAEWGKILADFVDYGNCFAGCDWVDQTHTLEDKTQVGYVGPVPRRYSPLDLVMNPISSNFTQAPKIIRTLITMGEVKQIIESETNDENKDAYEALWNYMRELRHTAAGVADLKVEDDYFSVAGFTSYRAYLESDYVELLTFMGDYYDVENDVFYKNHIIQVVDRHKVLALKPNPSFFGYPPVFHAGWRIRQDNLWAMGPLNNLLGLQYRLDHIENMKADVFDLITFPPLKIKGYVDDFEWGPFARIYTGEEGDVEMMAPPFQVLTANQEIAGLMALMEEMAGAPKEAMGFRTPGEKTAYEVTRLENAAARIFQAKIVQFEEQILEPWLNAALELSRRNLNKTVGIPVFDEEFDITMFQQLSPADITGTGRIRPISARHFAEKAEMIQNLTAWSNSPLGQDPAILVHFSGVKMAELMEDLLGLTEYQVRQPYVRLSEEADAKRQAQVHEEKVMMEAQTPSGLTPDDSDQGMGFPPPPVGGPVG